MRNVWKRITGNSRGIALIFTTFVVIGISMTLAGDFLKGVRQERMIGRAIKRIQAKNMAKFVTKHAIVSLRDHVRSTGVFPVGTGNEQIRNAFGVRLCDIISNYYHLWWMPGGYDLLWASVPWRTRMPLKGITAAPEPIQFICSREISPTSREYTVTFAVEHMDTLAQYRVSQKILVNIGKLYDYSVFYNGDLEIQAPLGRFYGPVYATGDVYLSRPDDDFVIRAPPGTWAEPFALLSSGNIYFGPKRSIARNYFLEDVGGSCAASDAFCRNPKYAAGIRKELRTHDDAYYTSPNRLEVNPDHWYRGNQVAFMQWVDTHESGIGASPQVTNPLPPYFYYFMNGFWYEDWNNNRLRVLDSAGAVISNLRTPSSWDAPPYLFLPSWAKDNTGNANSYDLLGRTYYTDARDYNERLSVSTAFDPANPPDFNDGDGFASNVQTKPVTNPNWWGVTQGASGNKIVWDNAPSTGAGSVPIRSIVTSVGNPHTIIEPIEAGDSDAEEAAKIQSRAHIRILCTDQSCGAFRWEAWRESAAGNFSQVASGDGFPPVAGFSLGNMYDYRLGRSLGVVDINFYNLLTYLPPDGQPLSPNNTLVVYVQVHPGPYRAGTAYNALVRLKQANQVPQGGFTLATNGRVWSGPFFNLYDYGKGRECSAFEDWNNPVWGGTPTCTVPPAAIFCDSFGVLSGQWSDLFDAGTPLSARRVWSGGNLKAAIITGDVPSQLVKGYPNCTGGTASGPVNFSGCRYADQAFALTTVQQPARVAWNGTYWRPLKSSADPSLPAGEFDCPAGLDPNTGQPLAPAACEYWLDNRTGIYYYNNLRPPDPGPPVKNFVQYSNYDPPYNDNPGWNIPLFGAVAAPYTRDNASPHGAEINFRENNMNGLDQFPDGPIPASSVFPGMTAAWTLSRQYLYNTTPNYFGFSVAGHSDSETAPLKLGIDDPVSHAQSFKGAAYLGDFGYMPLWVPKYSGGLENLINLQEAWSEGALSTSLQFRGSLLRLWDSVSLKTADASGGNVTPAFYRTDYYAAPNRNWFFDFEPSLRTNPPPASPDVVEIKMLERNY